ncbi:trimeric intracellular cation channel family protein [Marichromatium bheemlicum]|uniref:Trimeric intracellular cation channel family protein n=1 Tax=Marichromatium bheemlicum TaxID=365339 RepID=A0ABX1I3A6_9GAMM|nr:trimeric intracellular cation channel family protein [Marichromatium bheemlicum]NKN31963.1 trimeric intracellular cation channel family protein [Marichromatium bheemlicum]
MTQLHIPLDLLMYCTSLAAVAMMAAAAVLEAGRKRFDLFGMVVVALAAALGGGSLRDLLLDRPVFWIADQTYSIVALGAALFTFFLARVFSLPARLFLIPDALGLALFTVTGTKAALAWDAPWLVASIMGVITGVVGGILRDVLCNEEPLVFQGPLYATASWLGALVLLAMLELEINPSVAAVTGGSLVFLLRMAAIRWGISLPYFTTKE